MRRKYLIDAIAQRVGDAADNGAANFAGRHFPKLGRGHVRVESRMGRADQVGDFFQRTFNIVAKNKMLLANIESGMGQYF